MLARVLEAGGIATTSISMVREHTERVKPPRALFVPFPFGHALGRANDPALQHRVLRAALDLLAEPAGPVLRDFPDEAAPGAEPPAPAQASAIPPGSSAFVDPAEEVAQMRRHYEQWLERSGGRTAFGLSGIPAARFGDAIGFLETFAAGDGADMADRPSGLPVPGFVRYCVDDLKALYFEGRMAVRPAASGDEINRWFWAETSAGQLVRRVRARLDASDDPISKAAAFGVAR